MRWDCLIMVLWTWLFKGDRDETVGGAPRSRGLRVAASQPRSGQSRLLPLPVWPSRSWEPALGHWPWVMREDGSFDPCPAVGRYLRGGTEGRLSERAWAPLRPDGNGNVGGWAPPTLGLPLFVCLFRCLSSFWFLYRPHYITSLCNVARLLWELALPILCALLTGSEGILGF